MAIWKAGAGPKKNSTKKQKTVVSREGGGRGAASNEDSTVDTDDDDRDLEAIRLAAQKKRAEGVPRRLQRQADTADSVSLLSASNNESSHSSAATALLHLKEVRELKHRLQKAMDNQQAPYRRNRKSVFEESLMGRDLKAYVKLTLFRGVKFAVKDSHQMTETLIPACFTAMRLDEHKRVGRQSDFSCAILYAISQQRNRVSQEMARIFKGKHYREGGKGITSFATRVSHLTLCSVILKTSQLPSRMATGLHRTRTSQGSGKQRGPRHQKKPKMRGDGWS